MAVATSRLKHFLDYSPQETLFYTTGFFVTEYTMLRSTQYKEGLLSPVKIEDTWATIQRDLCMQVERRAKDLTSPAHFIQVLPGLLVSR